MSVPACPFPHLYTYNCIFIIMASKLIIWVKDIKFTGCFSWLHVWNLSGDPIWILPSPPLYTLNQNTAIIQLQGMWNRSSSYEWTPLFLFTSSDERETVSSRPVFRVLREKVNFFFFSWHGFVFKNAAEFNHILVTISIYIWNIVLK